MHIDLAEHTAGYLLENGYHQEILAMYTTDELQDLIAGNILNAMGYMATTSKDDPEYDEDIEHFNHFENAIRTEIDRRVTVDL